MAHTNDGTLISRRAIERDEEAHPLSLEPSRFLKNVTR